MLQPALREKLQTLRREYSLDEIKDKLLEIKKFSDFTEDVFNSSIKWAKSAGVGEKIDKPQPSNKREAIVKEFFENNSMKLSEAKIYAELMDTLFRVVGVDDIVPHKYINIRKSDGADIGLYYSRPNYLVVVPIDNSNSHNYPINMPAFKTPHCDTNVFFKFDGSVGNNMESSPEALRVPTKQEVQDVIVSVMVRNVGLGADILLLLSENVARKVLSL